MQRDQNGKLTAPGRSVTRRWDAISGALPSWLTRNDTGNDLLSTVTYGGTGADAYAQMNPTNVVARSCTIQADTVDLNDVEMIRLTVFDLYLSHPNLVGWNIGAWDDAPAFGSRLTLPSATSGESPYLALGSFPISSSSNPVPDGTDYAPRNNAEYKKPRTISHVMYPRTRANFAMEGNPASNNDSEFAGWIHPQMGKGVVIPRIRVTGQSTTARWMRFSGLELQIVKKG